MAQLAIKGHPTRGKEVIEILEMLGGKNVNKLKGENDNAYYFVGLIEPEIFIAEKCKLMNIEEEFILFTLEKFLEKFPYKVGDKVMAWINGYCGNHIIQEMQWDEITNEIKYRINGYWYSTLNLQPYTEQKDESMEEKKYRLDVCDDDKLATEVTGSDYKLLALDNYLIGKVTPVKNGMIVEYVKKKPQYPKTYNECCKIMGLDKGLTLFYGNYDCTPIHITEYNGALEQLLNNFMQLLICRDTYWKIAGEEMGLGKPWEPDFSDDSTKYNIFSYENEIILNDNNWSNRVLVFPTKEMRDAFYENFKELIEECKELL